MGPIKNLGVEQGGANSGDYYKIFGKEQLSAAQASGLGVALFDQIISSIGQADDTVLLSNCLHSLQNLLHLTLKFCSKHQVQLCIEKTKLLAVATPAMAPLVEYMKLTSPLNIEGEKINFVDTTEHVGILRSESSNLPNIMNRIKAHKNALGSVLHTGLARNHRGNPAASIRVEKLYATPKLTSGIGALVLLKSEINMLDHHLKETLEQLMRLPPRTPHCVVAFLAGSIPGTGLIHQRMLSIFGMVCRLKENVLHRHAINVLIAAKPSSKSWFVGIRDLCLQYGLPHPLQLLQSTTTKVQYKNMVKKQIISYWEIKLRDDAASLKSLAYFHPQYMSLTRPHPVWTTAGSNPYQVAMSTIQASMITGRYRTESLCSHWSPGNSGFCQAPSCKELFCLEDLHHILAVCGSLEPTRKRLADFTDKYCQNYPELQLITQEFCNPTHPDFCQFLVDCSALPKIILAQQHIMPSMRHHLFRITRTWCYCLHKTRLQTLGRWVKF